MNKVVLPGDGGIVSVIAGKFNDVKGSASTFTEINVFDIRLNKNGEMTANIPATAQYGNFSDRRKCSR